MIKVGQIGNGKFGEKILSKLNMMDDVEVIWICNSTDKWWTKTIDLDWVIIATPNELHYEQAKHFLKRGINVFCEKPGTLSGISLHDLIATAKIHKAKFYVDDVLSHQNTDPNLRNFTYKKWGSGGSNLIDRIAYHHFYLIYDQIGHQSCKIKIGDYNTPLHKQFQLIYDLRVKNADYDFSEDEIITYDFEYNLQWYGERVDSVKYEDNDALFQMLRNVLNETIDFDYNHERSIFATELSEFVKENLYGKCAVVGAGIYGITSAIKLSDAGYVVDLYDKEDDIMKSASGINQYRLHRGYHYPRSKDTIDSCKRGHDSFIRYFGQCALEDTEHYYGIASNESMVTPEKYLKVLDDSGLEWEITEPLPGCDLTIRCNEKLYDPGVLKSICYERLKGCGIQPNLNTEVKKLDATKYKHIIYATYANLNNVTKTNTNYQFELCEKPIFKLPTQYKNKSIVIMDGPFMCFDPYANTDYHVAGNVVHAIHVRNIGLKPEIPSVYKEYLNNGVIKNPKYTNVDRFIESARTFFPDIDSAEHIGSMYTIRTVLPNKDKTDERPTIVSKEDNNFILFSGKIGNCVNAANKIIKGLK
tara:strand:+ start:38281 stop:40041 length:1761 start_codon:yes stop_codon:yes gene_type:complete